METMDSLEASVRALIEASKKSREERDRAYRDAERIRNELHNTKETVKGLRLNIEKVEKTNKGYHKFGARKKEITDHIQLILSKLNQINNMDNITNDRG